MKLQEFQEIVNELSKSGGLMLVGVGPILPALPVLEALKAQVHPEDRDRIEFGVAPKGCWYVNVRHDS